MTITILPFRATLEQSCDWLEQELGTPWTLARLIEHGMTPWVWLDYDAAYPELFGDANAFHDPSPASSGERRGGTACGSSCRSRLSTDD